jgi:hypothetical protein
MFCYNVIDMSVWLHKSSLHDSAVDETECLCVYVYEGLFIIIILILYSCKAQRTGWFKYDRDKL